MVKQSQCKCRNRKKTKCSNLPFVPIDFNSDIRCLSQRAENFVMFKSESVCDKCKAICEREFEFNDIIFFNTETLGSATVTWDEIPKVIMLRGLIYILAGVIQFIPPITNEFKPHFISHVLRANAKWYIFDSSKKNLFEQKVNQELIPHLLVFVLPKMLQGLPKMLQNNSQFDGLTTLKENELILLRNFFINSKDGKTTYIKNSCGPDSLLQCLACCYKDSEKIRKIWNTESSQQNILMKFMAHFGVSNDLEQVHNMRNNLYRQHYKSIIDNCMETIDCVGNIYEILKEVITPTLPSITIN